MWVSIAMNSRNVRRGSSYRHRAHSGTSHSNSPIRPVADHDIRYKCALFVHRGLPVTNPYASAQFTRRSHDFYFGPKFLNFITSNLRLTVSQAPLLGTSSPFGYQLALDHPSWHRSGGARRRRFEIRHFLAYFITPPSDV